MNNRLLVALVLFLALTLSACVAGGESPDQMLTLQGENMLPTFPAETSFSINEFAYISAPPIRGDIVVFNHPEFNLPGLSRVVGLPNEQVTLQQGFIFINGARLNEPYIDPEPINDAEQTVLLGDDEFFVILDNRSRPYGDNYVITTELLVGRAMATCALRGLLIRCEGIADVDYGGSTAD